MMFLCRGGREGAEDCEGDSTTELVSTPLRESLNHQDDPSLTIVTTRPPLHCLLLLANLTNRECLSQETQHFSKHG